MYGESVQLEHYWGNRIILPCSEHAVIYKLSILEYHIEVSYSSQA